jgi:uncharacterized MAPEG superfamily protein
MPDTVLLPPGGFSLAHWCLLAAALMPLACAYIAKAPGLRRGFGPEGFDNRNPRAWLANQTGLQARANAAQANSFEALPFFFCAVLVAWQLGVPATRVNGLALAFVLLRVAYIACYLLDRPSLRSLAWALGWMVTLLLFFAGYR